jgi:asparagine synthase (glutamine-hydrolysing)
MCGIVGIYEYATAEGSVTPAVVEEMRDVLRHRGPDGEGLFVSDDRRVGFGHRRLSIVDLAGGAQPMYGNNGEVLVFNGEIYNYPKLRAELELEGCRFTTRCDTEVVLRTYEYYGDSFVDHLVGQFAFGLFDPRRERLVLARDPVGEKPLYFSDSGGRLAFASEAKALFRHPAINPAVDKDEVGHYLANLVVPSPASLFAGINKLPPGTIAFCTRRGLTTRRFWSTDPLRRRSTTPYGEAVENVRTMLEASTRDRLMADVPVGVLLSGGVDSTTLVAMLEDKASELASFCVGYEGEAMDERSKARRVAERFGIHHHEVTVSEREAINFLPKLVYHQDEPLADPVCVPLDFVCKLAADSGVKVVLAGEGADELFWGYWRYHTMVRNWRATRPLLLAPDMIRSRLALAGADAVSRAALALSQKGRGLRVPAVMADTAAAIGNGRLLPINAPIGMYSSDRSGVLGHTVAYDDLGWQPSGGGPGSGEHLVDTLMFDTQEYEFAVRLPELLLMRIDRFSMANSIEARVPFLDPALLEYVYRMPLTHKLHGKQTKRVLKDAVRGLIPDDVLTRPKQGFNAPTSSWFGGRMAGLLRSFMHEEAVQAYFSVPFLEETIALHERDRSRGYVLWPVLNFVLWHKRWVEAEPLEPYLEQTLAS